MASSTGTTLPGGYRNSFGGPADEWYAQTNGTAYATVAEACAAVPQAYRRNRTVIIGDDEYWWLQADLSDNGLVLKSVPGSPGTGGGSPAIYADFIFTATADGAQSFAMPAGTLGIDGLPSWYQADTKQVEPLANWDFLDGNLVVYAATEVEAGDKFFGRRYYGGAPDTGGGDNTGGDTGTGDIDVNRLVGIVPDKNLPPLTPEKVEQLTTLVNEENAQRGPFKLLPAALLDTPEDGAVEYNGVNVYITVGTVRKLLI